MTRSLTVWWDGVVAGSLALDRHGAMRFAYDGAWVADPDRPPVSFSLPKRPESYSTRLCTPFFEGLLPEGTQRDAVAAALGVSSANTFRLLAGLGEEVAGALTLCPEGEVPSVPEVGGGGRVLPGDQLGELLDTIRRRPLLAGRGDGPRLSLAGACQALGVTSARKYASDGGPGFVRCFDLVRRVCARPATAVLELLDAAIIQVLIGNADAHGKNYGILYDPPHAPTLAPLYDLMCTVAYPHLAATLAMKIGRGGYPGGIPSRHLGPFRARLRPLGPLRTAARTRALRPGPRTVRRRRGGAGPAGARRGSPARLRGPHRRTRRPAGRDDATGDPRTMTRTPITPPRVPRPPVVLLILVVMGALFAAPPLQDAATGRAVPFARLGQPLGYLLGAPLFGIWDAMSLLTVSQHYALLVTLILLYLARRVHADRVLRRDTAGAAAAAAEIPRRALTAIRIWMELGGAVGALLALLAFYAAAVFLPRPMVEIRLDDPELLAVDFHSHTNRSHDGWSRFTAARNRAWHEGGGFDAAYITDHYTWAGVDDAAPANPSRAGERTVMLSGMEVRLRNRHINLLGDRERYVFALDSTWHHLDPDSIAAARERGAPPVTMLYTIPGRLDQVVPLGPGSPAGVVGIELSDGAPRGLEQVKAERAEILALADGMDLAVVAGSNLHGWGRTVAAWSVMRLPGWRDLSPGELGGAIEEVLHRDRRRAVTVVERRMPYHDGSRVGMVLTVPWLLWEHFRMMTVAERGSWIAWITVLILLHAVWHRLKARTIARHREEADKS